MIIRWLANKLFPHISIEMQTDEGMINIHKRLQKLEKDSHPPLFSKKQLFKVHKRLEDLETVAFVSQFSDKYKNYEEPD